MWNLTITISACQLRDNFVDVVMRRYGLCIDRYLITTDPVHMALLRLVYDDVIKLKLAKFIVWWNTHPIRAQHQAVDSPHGRPDDLFANPSAYVRPDNNNSGEAFGMEVESADLDACDEFVNDYEQKRGDRPAPMRGDPKRITRADLTLPFVGALNGILSTLATPTMHSAKSIYKVALYMHAGCVVDA